MKMLLKLWAVLAILCLAGDALAEKKPVALVGAKYGSHEKKVIERTILIPEKIAFEDRGEWLDPKEFNRYSLVLLANFIGSADGKISRAWSPDEIAVVNEYVKNGGTLLFSSGVLLGLMGGWPKGFDTSSLECLGAKRLVTYKKPVNGSVLEKDSSYLKGIEKEVYGWTSFNMGLGEISTGTALVGARDSKGKTVASVFTNEFGSGRVFMFGMELFRMDKKSPDTRAYEHLIRNVILSANPLLTDEKKEQVLSKIKGPFLVWDAPESEEVVSLDFLIPVKGDAAGPIVLDMAGNEKESTSLLVTAKEDCSIHTFFEGAEIVKKAEILHRLPGFAWLEKVSGGVLTLKSNKTEELWFRFSTEGVEPGKWDGAIVCESSGVQTRVPVSIRVWKTTIPEKNYVRVQPYSGGIGFINGIPHDPKKREEFVRRIDAFFSNMRENRIDILDFYFNQYTLWHSVKINGVPFWDALKKSPEILEKPELPALDFSDYDPYLAVAAKYGLLDEVVIQGPSGIYKAAVPNIAKILKKEIKEGSPEYEKLMLWLACNLRLWLESKGAKKVMAKHLDEIEPERIPRWKETANLFAKAGYYPYSTWTGKIPHNTEFIKQLNPECTQWQVQSYSIDSFRTIVGEGPSLIDPADEVWYYGGGSNPYRIPYVYARLMGWTAGYYDLDGFGFWTYRGWHSEGTGLCFYRDGEVLSSPALEGLRDGIEDAQLYAMLNRKTRGDRRMWTPERYGHGLVGEKGAVLLIEPKTYGTYRYKGFSEYSTVLVREAKKRLLELLEG
jgi:hypothetical protein